MPFGREHLLASMIPRGTCWFSWPRRDACCRLPAPTWRDCYWRARSRNGREVGGGAAGGGHVGEGIEGQGAGKGHAHRVTGRAVGARYGLPWRPDGPAHHERRCELDLDIVDPARIAPSGGIVGGTLGQLHGEIVFSIATSDVRMGLIRAGTSDGRVGTRRAQAGTGMMSPRASPDCRPGESCPGAVRRSAMRMANDRTALRVKP